MEFSDLQKRQATGQEPFSCNFSPLSVLLTCLPLRRPQKAMNSSFILCFMAALPSLGFSPPQELMVNHFIVHTGSNYPFPLEYYASHGSGCDRNVRSCMKCRVERNAAARPGCNTGVMPRQSRHERGFPQWRCIGRLLIMCCIPNQPSSERLTNKTQRVHPRFAAEYDHQLCQHQEMQRGNPMHRKKDRRDPDTKKRYVAD